MASFNELLAEFTGSTVPTPQDKRQSVAAASSQKQENLSQIPTQDDLYRIAAARSSGTGASIQGEVQQDLRRLNVNELFQKYGGQAGPLISAYSIASNDYMGDRTADRSTWQTVDDAVNSAVTAGVSGLGGLGALGVGLVNDEAGTWVSDRVGDFREWSQEQQSGGLNARRRAFAARNEVATQDNAARYEQERKTDGNLVAGLRRIGRDALSSISNSVEDGTILSDGIAQGVGSLASGSLMGRGLRAMGAGKASMPIAIGSQEAGAAYEQTVSEALAKGATREEANRAGLLAAGIQGPVGAATGMLVSRFEANPFSVGSLRGAAGNIIRETLEEGVQSASGQLASNTGLRTFVDPEQDMLEGVGEETGLGALYGMGTAGVFQAPGVALRSSVKAAKLTGGTAVWTAKKAGQGLINRYERITSANAKASPRSREHMDTAMVAAAQVASLPEEQEDIRTLVEETLPNQEERQQVNEYLDKIFEAARFDPAEADQEFPVIGDAIRDSTDRFDALKRVANIVTDKNASAPDKMAAGLYLLDNIQKYQDLIITDLPTALEQVDESNPAFEKLQAFRDVVFHIEDHPDITPAIVEAQKFQMSLEAERLAKEQPETPEGQQAISNAIGLAQHMPDKLSPEIVQAILDHIEAKRLQVTQEQLAALNAANALHQEGERYKQRLDKLGLRPSDIISKQILVDEKNKKAPEKSASEHFTGVIGALRAGNTNLAREYLEDFVKFAQHMQNKVQAFNQSLANGDNKPVPFQALDPNTRDWYRSKGVYANPRAPNSIQFTQQTGMEAESLANMVNYLVDSLPQLGVEKVTPVSLDPALMGPADQIAEEFKSGARSARNLPTERSETAPEQSTQETALEPAQEPVSEREEDPDQLELPIEPVEEQSTQPAPQESEQTSEPEREEVSVAPAAETDETSEATGEVEAETEATRETTQDPEPTNIEDLFPELRNDPKSENRFLTAFRKPKKDRSRLLGIKQPLARILEALTSKQNFIEFSGNERMAKRLSHPISVAYDTLLELGVPAVLKEMNSRLQKKYGTMKGIPAGANTWLEGRVLNLTEEGPDGLQYNQELAEGAILAGFQWLLTRSRPNRLYDAEELAKKLGISEVDAESILGDFNAGLWHVDVVQTLAGMITQFWGVQARPDGRKGYTEGIPQAMAIEVLKGLEKANLITFERLQLDGVREQWQVRRNDDVKAKTREMFDVLAQFPTALEALVLHEPEEGRGRHIGAPPTRIAKRQMRNDLAETTRGERRALEAQQNTPYRINRFMYDFLAGLEEGQLLELFGEGDLNERKGLNINHRKSLESKNLTWSSAMRSLRELFAETQNLAELEGADPAQIPIYYEFGVSSVGRMHMEGAHNPQASKLTREVVLPSRENIDLTQKKNLDFFMLAMAQHLGEKVHKQPRAASIEKVKAKLEGALSPALEVLSHWFENSDSKKPLLLSGDDIQTIKDAFEQANLGKPTPAAIHSMIEYVRYQDMLARKAKDELSSFETALYLEADGVTDGPINALVNMVSGMFSSDWVRRVAKGGLFFGSRRMSINDYIQSDEPGANVDLYQMASDDFKYRLARLREAFADNPQILGQIDALLDVMSDLLSKDITFHADGTLTIDRGIAKNPLTITIYGSGKKGIAAKVTAALVDEIYRRMSEEGMDSKTVKGLEKLFFSVPFYDKEKDKLVIWNRKKKTKGMSGKETTLTLSKDMKENLQSNVLQFFVKPLVDSIDTIVGDTRAATSSIVEATGIQSVVFKHSFIARVQEKLAELEKAGIKADEYLTQEEVDQIYEDLKDVIPYIHTGQKTFMIASSNKGDIGLRTKDGKLRRLDFGRSLYGELRTPAFLYTPDNAGVSGVATVVIGTGDGMMMQIVMPQVEGAMQVFDGLNMKLSRIEQDSELVNKAVHEAWTGNPAYRGVAESFETWLTKNDLTGMSDELRLELSQVFNPNIKTLNEAYSEQVLLDHIQETRERVQGINLSIQARRNVLARVNTSIDHMASAESPYVKSDGIELSGTPEQVAERLRELYDEELEKFSKNSETGTRSKTEKATPPKDLDKALTSLGSQDESGATVIRIGNIRNKIRQLSGSLNSIELETARRALNSPQVAGYRVIYGTPEQTSAWLEREGIEVEANAENYAGVTLYDEKVIVLNEGSSETLLHELIHASTMEKVLAYYTDPSSLSQEEIEAVQRLEGLMQEWQDSLENSADLDLKTLVQAKAAQDQISHTLSSTQFPGAVNEALALNEFLSWVLANPELREQASRTKVTNPLLRIATEALKALKRLLFGKHKASQMGELGDDLYTNIRFNTLVLMKGRPSHKLSLRSLASFQARDFGTSDRLSEIRKAFNEKITNLTKDHPDPASRADMQSRIDKAMAASSAVTEAFTTQGFPMNMQEASTFHMLVHAFMTEAQLDPNALVRIQDIYSHVMKDLNSQDINDTRLTEEQFNTLTGLHSTTKDDLGRSTLMASFLALANVHEGFRSILRDIPMPRTDNDNARTLDERLDNLGSRAIDNLSRIFSGENRNAKNVQEALDSLTFKLMENAKDQENYINQFISVAGNTVDKANDWLVNLKDQTSAKVSDRLGEISENSNRKSVRALAKVGQIMAAMVNEEKSQAVSSGVISMMNKFDVWQPLHDIVNEVIGRTKDNMNVFDLIKLGRSEVSQTRQQFRENLPEIIAGKFSRVLSEQEWSDLYTALARIDLAVLTGRKKTEILSLIKNASDRSRAIAQLEEEITSLNSSDAPLIFKKSRELAEHMNTGKVSNGFLRNAEAIARLLGEKIQSARDPDPKLVKAIDELVTLYAFEGMSQETKNSVASLVQDEEGGVSFLFDYLVGQRKDEMAKARQTYKGLLNHYKGYVSLENQPGTQLIVAEDKDFDRLTQMGFTRIADYKGSPAEVDRTKRGYYFAPVSGRSMFNQGIFQNVRASAYGVDPVTGFSFGSMTAGRITNPKEVKRITRLMAKNEKATEPLMPIYDGSGGVVAYERSLDPSHEFRLNRNTHMAKVLGQWRGRQVEEAKADFFNKRLVDELGRIWDQTGPDRRDEFIDLFDPNLVKTDPVAADAMSLLTPDTREHIRAVFGGNTFMVRKDMLHDAIGYRAPSVSDLWTGTTRFDPKTAETARKIAIGAFGMPAYTYLVRSEKFWQGFVTEARTNIIVKSVIVPAVNIISNVYHLASVGVPLRDIARGMTKKIPEIDSYVKGRLRKIELEAELRASQDNTQRARLMRAEIQSIEDGWKNLSIWPLIQAGEFSSISEATIGQDERLLAQGKLADYVGKLVDRLPEPVKNAGRYAIITRDTALFQGLQRAVEYGDFLAKATLYDDLVKRKKQSKEYALGRVTEEFINYDRLPGRARSYLESMGLTWFWHFKLRSIKIALSTVRNNPLHVLLASLAPTPDFFGSVGLPVEDNLISKAVTGDLGYSIGPGQGFRSVSLHPWVNLST